MQCNLACILPCIPACIRHPFRSTSSVQSYLRSYLTADSRTSLVPAMFHFLSIFITFIYRYSRDLWSASCIYSYCVSFTIQCVFNDTPRHYASIRRPSPATIPGVHPGVHPSFIRHPIRSISSVQSYLRSDLTADSRTSLVPAIFHFYFHFYYFHLSMFERFMKYNVSFTIHCVQHQISRTSILYSTFFIIF
jgi:hypothetical protein